MSATLAPGLHVRRFPTSNWRTPPARGAGAPPPGGAAGDGQQDAGAHALADQALVPAGNDHTHADLEGQGTAAIKGVVEVGGGAEDRAVVVAGNRVADLDHLAVARAQDLDDEFVGGGALEGEGGLAAEFAGDRNVLHGVFPCWGRGR